MQIKPGYALRDNDLQEAIIKAFPKDQYEVTSVYLEGRPTAEQPESSSEHIKYFDLTPGQMKGLRLVAMWKLYKFCRVNNFDVVYLNRFKPIHMMLILNRWLKIPKCIGIIHGLGDLQRPYRRKIFNRFIDASWKVVAVSNAVRDDLVGYRCGLNKDNTLVIPNAVDVKGLRDGLLPSDEARQELGLKSDSLVFGSIGRLVAVKGQKYLLEAFKRLVKKYPHIELVIIGDGKLEHEFATWVDNNGLRDSVHFPGFKENAYRYTSAFDCFVLPSLSEGMPLAIMEAMSASLPIVATNVGGNAEVLGESVETIPSKDVDALCEKLEGIIAASPEERQKVGATLFDRVMSDYDIHNYQARYRALAHD
ncbi:hypothetical protein R50073_01760 [Maricurvus nonylphenolicus]